MQNRMNIIIIVLSIDLIQIQTVVTAW